MDNSQKLRQLLYQPREFIEKYKNPASWKGSVADYAKMSDRHVRRLIYVIERCNDNSITEEAVQILEALSTQKAVFQFFWLDKSVEQITNLTRTQEKITKEQTEIKDDLSHFETRMIEVFSVVMGLIGFVFVTAEKVSNLEFLDCLKFCLIYIFSVSLFVVLIKCIMTKKMDSDDLKTLGVIISVPAICVALLILMIFLI